MAYNTSATVTCNISASPGAQVYSTVVPDTTYYTIQGTLQLEFNSPSMSSYGAGGGAGTGVGGAAQSNSSVVAVVKHGASTIYTSAAGDRGFVTACSATAGDTISVNLYSSASLDQQLNSSKLTISIWEGQEGI